MNSTITTVSIIILFLWVVALTVLYAYQQLFFRKFTKDVSKKDLKSSLQFINTQIQKNKQNHSQNEQTIEVINKEITSHFQKMGFKRYNPYSDTGGDQSFCLCLLDDTNTGVIISSLHSREQTRIYAKDITKGDQGDHVLSKEEEEVLKMAMKQ